MLSKVTEILEKKSISNLISHVIFPVVDHCFQNNSCPENSQCQTTPGANETECECNPGFVGNLCQCKYFSVYFH